MPREGEELGAFLLAEALWQLLDDMGLDGHCVCPAAKEQAMQAYRAFRPEEEHDELPSAFIGECGR